MDAQTRIAVAFERMDQHFASIARSIETAADAMARIADSVEREEVRWADTRAVRDPDPAG
jgi:pilus assembly protein TadC